MRYLRRHPLLAASVAAALVLTGAAVTASAAPASTATVPTATPSGLDGGGFVNVVAVDPQDPNLLVAGGDVSGLHRSVDGGVSWSPANVGLWNLNQFHVADVQFSTAVPGRVYAAVGYRGQPGGGLMASDDDGATWRLVSDDVQFSGANNGGVGGLPSTHPRSTGDLLVLSDQDRTMTAATFDQGVLRSTDGGASWQLLGLASSYLRGAVADPVSPADVLVAAYGDGLYRVSGSGAVTAIAGSPQRTEELAAIGSDVFAAAGTDGVFRSGDGGRTWQNVVPGSAGAGPAWISVAGGRDPGGRVVVYVGCTSPAQERNGVFTSVLGSTDGGDSWASLTSNPAAIDPGSWWLGITQPFMKLGQGSYVAAQISTSSADPTRVYVAGRSGVWRSVDGGGHWRAGVDGLGVTINRDVVVDPTTPSRVYVANTDWVLFGSEDGLDSVQQIRPPGSNTGYGLGLDATTTPAALAVATGDRDTNTAGEVFTSADPLGGQPWVDEGLGSMTGSKVPVAVAMNHVGGQRILLVAVDGDGLWRKVGGTWSRVSDAAASPLASNSAAFSWAPGSSVAYLYEPDTGLWRSSDAGASWALLRTITSDTPMTGHLAADPAVAGRLFLSVASGLFRVDGAAGPAPTFTDLGVDRPGPVAVDGGVLYASSRPAKGASARLLRSSDAGSSWTAAADSSYSAGGGNAFALSSGGGRVFAAMNGNGVMVVSDGSAPPPPPTTAPPTTAPPGGPPPPGADTDGDGFSDAWDPTPLDAFAGSLTMWAGTAQAGDVRVSLATLTFYDFTLRSVQVNTAGRSCMLILDPSVAVASAPNAATIESTALCMGGIEFGPVPFSLTIVDGGAADTVHVRLGDDPERTFTVAAGDLHVAGAE